MGDLVKGQPQAKVGRREGVPALKGHQVGTHVVDEILVLSRFVLQHQEVVLAQHPGGHPPQYDSQLNGPDPGGQRRWAAAGTVGHTFKQRTQEALQRGQVGPDPVGPVDDSGPGIT